MSTTALPETTYQAPFSWSTPFKRERWTDPDGTVKGILSFFAVGMGIVGMGIGFSIQSALFPESSSEFLNTVLGFLYAAVITVPAVLILRKYLKKVAKKWSEEYLDFRDAKGKVLAAAIRSLDAFDDDEEIQHGSRVIATGGRYYFYSREGYKYEAEVINHEVVIRLRDQDAYRMIQLDRVKDKVDAEAHAWVAANPNASTYDAFMAGRQMGV